MKLKQFTFPLNRLAIVYGILLYIATNLSCDGIKPTNLALGKNCKVFSSIEADGWSKNLLTDGKTGSKGWSSKAFPAYQDHRLYPEYIVIDLEASAIIDHVVLHLCKGDITEEPGLPPDFSISVCNDGEPWREVLRETSYSLQEDTTGQSFKTKNARGRYLKVEATRLRENMQGEHYFRLAEIAVFGNIVAKPEPFILPGEVKKNNTVVTQLKCENRPNPAGIDSPEPRLSWCMESTVRGQKQTAYHVLVASTEQLLRKDKGDMWDSEKIQTDRSIAIRYKGKALESGQKYWWKTMLFDKDGKSLPWSEPAFFIMGKLQPDDWKGHWIGANLDTTQGAFYLRKQIEIEKPVKQAMVYFCGLGLSELYIEGRKVGNHVVSPGFTTYNKRTQYLTFDVTEYFTDTGEVTLGVILAGGWYDLKKEPWVHKFHTNPYVDQCKLLLNLHLEHTDGTESVIVSDDSWKWHNGEITYSWIAQEDIDQTKTNPGWDKSAYNDENWPQVAILQGPAGKLVTQKEPLCYIIEEIQPMTLTYNEKTKSWIYDFGREATGWVRFRTTGPPNTRITITTIPNKDEAPDENILNRPSQFVLTGTGSEEIYEPRFFYAGMRKVEISGSAVRPKLEDLSFCLVSSGWKQSGSFQCSDDLVNWMHESVYRTSVNYTTYLPTDPVREWKPWTQDIQSMFVSNTCLFDSQTMYERWQWDIIDGQREDGNCPNVTPGAFFDAYNSPWWGGCAVWLPWHWYLYYGDASLLEESYAAMKRYVDFQSNRAEDGLQDWGLADWLSLEETPKSMINTPAHYLYATIVSKTAGMMGNTEDMNHYGELSKAIRNNFNMKFLKEPSGHYEPNTQASQVLPLVLGMVPENNVPDVNKALLENIASRENHLSTGFVSTPYLLETIAILDPETGWKMTTAQDYPSWYSMTAGSDNDLMKEKWTGGQALMPSLGGNLAGWHFQSLGGIRPDPGGPGFKKIIIRPNIVGDLHWVKCSYNSAHGKIVSNWQRRGDKLRLELVVPANTTATVYLPADIGTDIYEDGRSLEASEGIRILRMENGRAVLNVSSGHYQFTSILPLPETAK